MSLLLPSQHGRHCDGEMEAGDVEEVVEDVLGVVGIVAVHVGLRAVDNQLGGCHH